MPLFVVGVELARAFYAEAIGPALAGRPHAAALIGAGSDVLGYDTERSTDHGWGPRLQVFVDEAELEAVRADVLAAVPEEFRGWPTDYDRGDGAVGHQVEVTTVADWCARHLGFDPRHGVTPRDWLTAPQQLLLEATAGAVFHDDTGELGRVRDALAWFPDDVWRWLMACQWHRIAQEEPFVGRTVEVGDDLGSMVLAARLVRDAVRVALLQERRYAPYAKWLGSAFGRLSIAAELGPLLSTALTADDHAAREAALVEAYVALARNHNRLAITSAVDPSPRSFHGRPFTVIDADRFARACRADVGDRWLRSLPLVGAVDQFADSTDILSHADRSRLLGAVYD